MVVDSLEKCDGLEMELPTPLPMSPAPATLYRTCGGGGGASPAPIASPLQRTLVSPECNDLGSKLLFICVSLLKGRLTNMNNIRVYSTVLFLYICSSGGLWPQFPRCRARRWQCLWYITLHNR